MSLHEEHPMSVDLEESQLTKDSVLAAIPAFPPVVLRVLDLLSGDHPDMVPLVREIGSDATLSAQVLRMANSPLFGLASQIDTVHRAVVTLGFVHIQSLVTMVATANYMRDALKTEALEKCWRHTMASALLCRELGRAAGIPPDRAYSFGLLHDIGRLGLLVAYPQDYDRLCQAADRDAVSLLDLEKKRFGMDHCEAGRRLVEQWKLPQEFCVIAGRHHDPPSGVDLDALTVVHLACQLADTLGYFVVAPHKEVPFEEILSRLPIAARERFPDNPDTLREMLDAMIAQDHAPGNQPDLDQMPTIAVEPPSSPEPSGDSKAEDPSLFASLDKGPVGWDVSVVLLAGMVVLALLAGAFCLWKV